MNEINFLSEKEPDNNMQNDEETHALGSHHNKKHQSVVVEFHNPEPEKNISLPSTTSFDAVKKIKSVISVVSGILLGFLKKTKTRPSVIPEHDLVSKSLPSKEAPKIVPQPIFHIEKKKRKPSNNKETKDITPVSNSVSSQWHQDEKETQDTNIDALPPLGLEGVPELDINLMPWYDPHQRRYQRIRKTFVMVTLAVMVVWALQIHIRNTIEQARIDALEEEIVLLETEIEKINSEELLHQSQLVQQEKKFFSIYNTLPHWSQFLSWLERTTHQNVYYTNLSTSSDRSISLTAIASDYTIAAEQLLAFKNEKEWVVGLTVNEFTQQDSGLKDFGSPSEVEFVMQFSIPEERLLFVAQGS